MAQDSALAAGAASIIPPAVTTPASAAASGRLEALMRSGLRHCEKFAVIDAHGAGETQAVAVQRIGPDLVFGRLWNDAVSKR